MTTLRVRRTIRLAPAVLTDPHLCTLRSPLDPGYAIMPFLVFRLPQLQAVGFQVGPF